MPRSCSISSSLAAPNTSSRSTVTQAFNSGSNLSILSNTDSTIPTGDRLLFSTSRTVSEMLKEYGFNIIHLSCNRLR